MCARARRTSSSSTPPAATPRSAVTAHGLADLIVTPMNDSFVDFDMLGVSSIR